MVEYLSWIKNDDFGPLIDDLTVDGNYDLVLEQVPPNEDEILKNHPTLLSVACFFASLECVRSLLGQNASILIADDIGRLPIHFAAGGGSIEIIQLLFNHGANLFIRDKQSIF